MQPSTPVEHDIFEALVKHHDGDIKAVVGLTVECGVLQASFLIPVPELETVNPSEHPDSRVGIVLKADANAARAAQAKAADDAKKAQDKRDAEIAANAAKAQKVQDDTLINTAARAGAVAATEVLKQQGE